jgi:hypothetical protein
VIHLLNQGETDLASAIAEFFDRQAYARWWVTITDHIHHDHINPATAVAGARTAARQALVDLTTPHHACPFTHGQAIATLEATRRFYHATQPR